jgi:hypothetical protein
MNVTVLKLIFRRFALKLGYRIWSGWLSIIVFSLPLGFVLRLIRSCECPVRRALGYAWSRSENAATAFHPRSWEQDCKANGVRS